MKLYCHDKSYGKDLDFEMEDGFMGSELSLIFEYLNNYKEYLQYKNEFYGVFSPLKSIPMKAKIDKIIHLQKKYNGLIKYLHEIDMEENAL